MSFIDDIVDVGRSVVGYLGGNGIGNALARTAVTGLVLNQVSKSINRDNQASNNTETIQRLQVNPDPNAKIPVVYGQAVVSGIVTDAQLTNSNTTMYYCLTLCEKTGNIGLGSGAASVISFLKIWYNNELLTFQSDGITVASGVDNQNNVNTKLNNQIKIWCFNGGSSSQVFPYSYSPGTSTNAYDEMPNWTSAHTMDDLVFAIVRIDYNRDNGVTSLGDFKFQLSNTMNLAGDCLYDYMTNTRYGAGIPSTEIYVS